MIKRYDLPREYRGNIGTPAITEQPEGEYVLYDDYAAVFDELRAEKDGLEAIVAGQAGEIAESRRILAGLPQDAIDGGWTAKGISAHAKALEAENERLRDALECIAQPYATPSLGDPAVLREFARAALTQQEQGK